MAPPVEGTLDFVARRYPIDRAVPLGDIEYVDGKNPSRDGDGDGEEELVPKPAIDRHSRPVDIP
ncbi:hypothetical protein E4P40_14325 [Blastococcus sp. CT_GayMR20]|uniref:hypothetical protein n=1 Tax=Blastococcus sp. CT_GayMR20 TaxID=2559609 RepID=UPI001073BA7A|nr:hypothetical protein [Blastococcus sp. CT_GayMR20]TFV83344.1 hypothetical protein E4P40_14325 [Blastococcus sp. CT_GayMR20]